MNDLDRLDARLLILAAGRNCPGKEALRCLGINDTSSLQLCNPFCYLDSGGLQFLLDNRVDLVLHGVVKGGRAGHEEEGGGHSFLSALWLLIFIIVSRAESILFLLNSTLVCRTV